VNGYDETRGEGWILFAGMMLMLAGFLNAIFGIAAIDDSVWFSGDDRYVIFDNLNTWGWFLLIVGVLQLVSSFSIWNRHSFGRVMGIAFASLNAMILLFTVNAFPIAAFMLFILDLLVIYGLTVYGGRAPAASASRDRSV
jgi:hypothetical protein